MILYLIPTPIAENTLNVLPPATVAVARQLDFFIVERAKTARHFIKSIQPERPLQEMTFVEIDEQGTAEAAFMQAILLKKSVGLLSEAGCPGIADPGARLVALAHERAIRVQPLVGPSSIFLALMASGMSGQSFSFHGYLSPKRPELAQDLRRLEQLSQRNKQTQIFIETPYRNKMIFEVALQTLQANTKFGWAQDLTGTSEMIETQPIAIWKKKTLPVFEKFPAVFLIF